MGCGVTVLGIYSLVASLIIVVHGVLINTDYCDEISETDCKDFTVENGGSLTEVHNKMVKVDLFNADNGVMGVSLLQVQNAHLARFLFSLLWRL